MLLTEANKAFLCRALGPKIPNETLANFRRMYSVDVDARSARASLVSAAVEMLANNATAKSGAIGWAVERHLETDVVTLSAYANCDLK